MPRWAATGSGRPLGPCGRLALQSALVGHLELLARLLDVVWNACPSSPPRATAALTSGLSPPA
jgi:hypothetical protein